MLNTILSGASAYVLIEQLNQKWMVSLATWTSESASLAKAGDDTTWAVAVLGFAGGLIVTGILWAIALSAKDCEGKLGPVASVIYKQAQDVLIDALKVLLPIPPEEIEKKELPQLLSHVADYFESNDPEKLFSVFENILDRIKKSEQSNVNDYFPGMGNVENISKIMARMKNTDKLIIECKVGDGLKNLIKKYGGGGIQVPNTITLLGGSKEDNRLPGMLPVIAFLTSPRVEFKIGDGQTTMSFWAFRYFKDHNGLDQQKVEAFVSTYLQNRDLLEEIEKEIKKTTKTT
jgi:hypothetical protein